MILWYVGISCGSFDLLKFEPGEKKTHENKNISLGFSHGKNMDKKYSVLYINTYMYPPETYLL